MKKLYTLALSVLLCASAMADQLTPAEALQRLYTANTPVALCARSANTAGRLKLAYTSTSGTQNSYYAFNDSQGGYVLLSADDCLPAVLGTSDTGTFDYQRMPEQKKWFLSIYDKAVENYSRMGVKQQTIKAAPIAPLLVNSWLGDIQWGQDRPYCNYCPTYKGDVAPTGCMITAMAQVMAYHKWPVHGYGAAVDTFRLKIRKDSIAGTLTTLTVDLSKTTYDWNNMLPKYINTTDTSTQNYNQQQADAVATLMYHCGVAAKAQFGVGNSEGTEAAMEDAAKALTDHFGYSRAVELLYHYAFTNEDWDNIVYNEIWNGRPVIFAGTRYVSEDGGHAIIADGFKDGLFHINWGWDGNSNEFYYVTGTGLNADYWTEPENTANNFGYNLEAMIGIEPDRKADEGGSTRYDKIKMSTAEFVTFLDHDTLTMRGYFFNSYRDSISIAPSIALIDKDTLYCSATDSVYRLACNRCIVTGQNENSYSVKLPKDIPAGSYIIAPSYTEDGRLYGLMNCYPGFQKPELNVYKDHTFELITQVYYSIDTTATARILDGRQEFLATPRTDTPAVQPDSLTLVLSHDLQNASPYYDIYLGVMFRSHLSGIETYTFENRDYLIYPKYVRDRITVRIPKELGIDSTYTVYPIVWPAIFPDRSIANYQFDAMNICQVVIADSTFVPSITIRARKPTAVEDICQDGEKQNQPQKFLRDGILYIRRDDRLYNATGQRLR